MVEADSLKYLGHYPPELLEKVHALIKSGELAAMLRNKYPTVHNIKSDKALYDFVMGIKNDHFRKSGPIARISWDGRICTLHHSLGLHRFISRLHGAGLRASNEILIASVFKNAPLPFLRMVAVHELAHLKEKEHNRAFFNLCLHIEPDFHQIEFDMRLFLTCRDLFGSPYGD